MFRQYIEILLQSLRIIPTSFSIAFLFLLIITSVLSMVIPLNIYNLIIDNDSLDDSNVLYNVISVLVVTAAFGFFNLLKYASQGYMHNYGIRLFSIKSINVVKEHNLEGSGLDQFERMRHAYVSTLTESFTIIFGTTLQIILAFIFLYNKISIEVSLLCVLSILLVLLYSIFARKYYSQNRFSANDTLKKETEMSLKILSSAVYPSLSGLWYRTVGKLLIKNLRINLLISLPVYVIMLLTLILGYFISYKVAGVAGVVLWQMYFVMLLQPMELFSNNIESILNGITDIHRIKH